MAIWPVAAMLDNAALGVYLIVFPKQPAILTSFPHYLYGMTLNASSETVPQASSSLSMSL